MYRRCKGHAEQEISGSRREIGKERNGRRERERESCTTCELLQVPSSSFTLSVSFLLFHDGLAVGTLCNTVDMV